MIIDAPASPQPVSTPATGRPSRPSRARRTGWVVVALGSWLVGAYALAVVASGFRLLPAEVAANGLPLALRVHVVASAVALLVGPTQLAQRVRDRRIALHRALGRVYVLACVVGGVSGGLVAWTTTSGPVARWGFLGLAAAWLVATTVGVTYAVRRDIPRHRAWITVSFALTFAAVTLRLYLGVALGSGLEFSDAYPVIAWACWVPNLLVALWLVHRVRRDQPSHVERLGPART